MFAQHVGEVWASFGQPRSFQLLSKVANLVNHRQVGHGRRGPRVRHMSAGSERGSNLDDGEERDSRGSGSTWSSSGQKLVRPTPASVEVSRAKLGRISCEIHGDQIRPSPAHVPSHKHGWAQAPSPGEVGPSNVERGPGGSKCRSLNRGRRVDPRPCQRPCSRTC